MTITEPDRTATDTRVLCRRADVELLAGPVVGYRSSAGACEAVGGLVRLSRGESEVSPPRSFGLTPGTACSGSTSFGIEATDGPYSETPTGTMHK